MKLSLACTLATFVSMAVFVAIFVLSALLYENLDRPDDLAFQPAMATDSTQPRPVVPPATPSRVANDFRTNYLPGSEPPVESAIPKFQPKESVETNASPNAIEQVKSNSIASSQVEQPFFEATNEVSPVISSINSVETSADVANSLSSVRAAKMPQEQVEDLLPDLAEGLQDVAEETVSDFSDFNGLVQMQDTPNIEENETKQDARWLKGLADQQTAINSLDPFAEQLHFQPDQHELLGRPEATALPPTPEERVEIPATASAEVDLAENDAVITSAAEAVAVNPGADLSIDILEQAPVENTIGDISIAANSLKQPAENLLSEIQSTESTKDDLSEEPELELPAQTGSDLQVGESRKQQALPSETEQQLANQENSAPSSTDTRKNSPVRNTSTEKTNPIRDERGTARLSGKRTTEITGWPLPESLVKDLRYLRDYSMTQEWAIAAINAFDQLNQLELGSPESRAWIEHCHSMAKTLRDHVAQVAIEQPRHRESCAYMSQIAHRMKRRAEIWAQVHKIAAENYGNQADVFGEVVATRISQRKTNLNLDSLDPLWIDYLMLDRAQEIFSDPKSKAVKHRAIAHKILARTTSSALTAEQRKFAQNVVGEDLGSMLRSVAAGPIDLGQFLIEIEKFESNPTTAAETRLTSRFQNYYWNQDPEIQVLARLIDDHYRNANIQIEFSQELINRMIPEPTTHHEPVTDRILGANVFGQSRITNRIHVQLVPEPDHLSFRFQSNGRVLSNTRAHARGFTFSNLGNGLVNASKEIAVGEGGISLTPTNVNATSQNRLIGVKGQLDNLPVFGGIARRMAQQQHEQQGPQARQIVENKMRSEFQTRIDTEFEAQVQKAREWFQARILDPLHAMELEPKVVHLQTTQHAAVVRYRLASLDQMAANTPRPASSPGSLANFQIHRTAINNIINRIQINGRKFTPQEFMDHLNMLLGRNDLAIPAEQNREDDSFEFASRDPILIDFQENHLCLTLRIRRLQLGKKNRWKNLTVSARYAPTAMGQQMHLKFDEVYGLRVDGRLRLTDQLAVRTVFSALFKPDFQFNLLPPAIANHRAASGLGISQMVLSQGWLSISMNQTHARQQMPDQRASNQRILIPPVHRRNAPGQSMAKPGPAKKPPQRTSRFYRPESWPAQRNWR